MTGAPLRLSSFVTPEIVLSLCGLAALAVVPVLWHRRSQEDRPTGP